MLHFVYILSWQFVFCSIDQKKRDWNMIVQVFECKPIFTELAEPHFRSSQANLCRKMWSKILSTWITRSSQCADYPTLAELRNPGDVFHASLFHLHDWKQLKAREAEEWHYLFSLTCLSPQYLTPAFNSPHFTKPCRFIYLNMHVLNINPSIKWPSNCCSRLLAHSQNHAS